MLPACLLENGNEASVQLYLYAQSVLPHTGNLLVMWREYVEESEKAGNCRELNPG